MIFVLFNLFSQFGFKLFLSFFIETLACHLPWTMPVALITAADGVYHPTSATLIIGRQHHQGRPGRRSICQDRFACGVCIDRERSFEEACSETEVGRRLLVPEPRPLPPLALQTCPQHANRIPS